MPIFIGIAAGLGAALGAASLLGGLGVLGGALLFGGLAAAQLLLTPKPETPELSQQTRRFSITSAREAGRYALGRTRIPGWITWAKEGERGNSVGASGRTSRNQQERYFHFVAILGRAPFDSIEAVWIDGKRQTIQRAQRGLPNYESGGPGDRHGHLFTPYADQSQAPADAIIIPADDNEDYGRTAVSDDDRNVPRWMIWPQLDGSGLHADLTPPMAPEGANAWSAAHRAGPDAARGLPGKAYLYVVLFQPGSGSDPNFVWRSIPNIEVLVRGLKFRVPIDADGTLGPEQWTNNAADCLYWIIRNRMGVPLAGIDIPAFLAARARSAEMVGAPLDTVRDYVAARGTVNGVRGTYLYAVDGMPTGTPRSLVYRRIGNTGLEVRPGSGGFWIYGMVGIGRTLYAIAGNSSVFTALRQTYLYSVNTATAALTRIGGNLPAAAQTRSELSLILPSKSGAGVLYFTYSTGDNIRSDRAGRVDVSTGTYTAFGAGAGMLPVAASITTVMHAFLYGGAWYLLIGTSEDFTIYPFDYTDAGVLTFQAGRRFQLEGIDPSAWGRRSLVGVDPAENGTGVAILYREGVLWLTDAEFNAGGRLINAVRFTAATGDTLESEFFGMTNTSRPVMSPTPGYPDSYMRYTFDGMVTADDDLSRVVQGAERAMSGMLVALDGRLVIRAGEERPAALHITDGDIVETTQLQVSPPYAQRINAATIAVAQSAEHDWQRAAAPELVDAEWVAFDGEKLPVDLGVEPYVAHLATAERLVSIAMRKLRGGVPSGRADDRPSAALVTYRLRPGPAFVWYTLIPGDRVLVTDSETGWTALPFEVLETTPDDDATVLVSLRESPAGIYDDATISTTAPPLPPIPDPPRIAPPPTPATPPSMPQGVTATPNAVVDGGAIRSTVTVAWTAANIRTQVRITGPSGSGYSELHDVAHSESSTVFSVPVEGEYTVTVWHVEASRSPGVEATATVSWMGLDPGTPAGDIRDFALDDTSDTAARTGIAELMAGATTDDERLDYTDLKNRPRGGGQPGTGSQPTNLGIARTASGVTITSSTGANAAIPAAGTGNNAGVMTDAQADKLQGIAAGAQVNRTFGAIATGLNALAGAARLSFAALRAVPVFATRWPSYAEVTGAKPPVNAEANVKADWDATSGDAEILNKPVIPTLRGTRQYTVLPPAAVPTDNNTADVPISQALFDANRLIQVNQRSARVALGVANDTVILTIPGLANVGQVMFIRNRSGLPLVAMTAARLATNGRGHRRPDLQTVAVANGDNAAVLPLNNNALVELRLGAAPDLATTGDPGLVEKATANELALGTADKWPDAATIKARLDQITAGTGTQPTVYGTLAELPDASSLATGTRAIVRATTAPYEIMEFMVDARAAGSRRWRCIYGTSRDLVNQNVAIAREHTWVAVGSLTWDVRFPYQLINFGGWSVSDRAWNDGTWRRFPTDLIEGLAAGVAGQSAGGILESIVARDLANNRGQQRGKRLAIGRTESNGILIRSAGIGGANNFAQPSPLRIRGSA